MGPCSCRYLRRSNIQRPEPHSAADSMPSGNATTTTTQGISIAPTETRTPRVFSLRAINTTPEPRPYHRVQTNRKRNQARSISKTHQVQTKRYVMQTQTHGSAAAAAVVAAAFVVIVADAHAVAVSFLLRKGRRQTRPSPVG